LIVSSLTVIISIYGNHILINQRYIFVLLAGIFGNNCRYNTSLSNPWVSSIKKFGQTRNDITLVNLSHSPATSRVRQDTPVLSQGLCRKKRRHTLLQLFLDCAKRHTSPKLSVGHPNKMPQFYYIDVIEVGCAHRRRSNLDYHFTTFLQTGSHRVRYPQSAWDAFK
jgi:hypothetical protein